VGDEKITQKEFDQLIESLPEQARAQAQGPMKRQMAEQIARVKLLAAEARKKGLDKDPSVKARIQFQTENLLAGAAYNEYQKTAKVDEPAVRKYYDEHKGEFEKVEARHILIKFKGSPVPNREGKEELTEEQALAKAQEIRKKLAAGEDFAKLAKEESDDVGSGSNGGSLGSFGHGQMVPEFEKAAFALPAGQVSEPIKTQFGYHVIRVDKHDSQTFEELRPQLEQRMRPEAARTSVEELRKSANVVMDEAYFGPATTAVPAPQVPPAAAPKGQ
jgi:parvulin-like peptidyl-prolyl isomerase